MELCKPILFLVISSALLLFCANAICIPRNDSIAAVPASAAIESASPFPLPSPSPVNPPNLCVSAAIESPSPSPLPLPSASPSPVNPLNPSFSAPIESPSPSPLPSPSPFNPPNPSVSAPTPTLPSISAAKICAVTSYPQVCLTTATPLLSGTVDPVSLLKLHIQAHRKKFEEGVNLATEMGKSASISKWIQSCLSTCIDVYRSGLSDLDEAVTFISSHDIPSLMTRLSAVLSYSDTCEESFTEDPDNESLADITQINQEMDQLASNSLRIAGLLE